MIKSITVTNHLDESIKIELGFPERSGFLIKNIDGLGPAKADINMNDFASGDGAKFTSARVNPRNIVITLKYLFAPTVEDVRQKSYKYFPIKKEIKLTIETDNRICEIYGRVESNEPDMFSSDGSAKISIMCPDPYFYSAGEDGKTVSIFYANEPLFEFDFSNESLSQSLIEFGEIISKTEQTIYYEGDADVGVLITMHAIGAVTNVSIYNTLTRESMKIDTSKLTTLTGQGIIQGDTIYISTTKGNKYVYLLRNGNYINILNALDKGADWLQITKGDNIFAYDADSGFNNLEFRIENQTVYEGV